MAPRRSPSRQSAGRRRSRSRSPGRTARVPRNVVFERSPRKGKKYRVTFTLGGEGHAVDFGQKGYEQFRDRTPLHLYSGWDHGDTERRRNYLARASGIRDGAGRLTRDDPASPNYWSIRYLW